MAFAGVDIGAQSAKAVILNDGAIAGYAILPTGSDVARVSDRVMKQALKKCGLPATKLERVVATGYGRMAATFANSAVTEITCHAEGASFLVPGARTVIDIGGQDSKVIKIDDKGRVLDFVMNDKCAAGTGRFLEVIAMVLKLKLADLGDISLSSNEAAKISSVCTIFAESEVVSLRAEGKLTEDIIAGVHHSVARRVVAMGSRIGYQLPVVFSGGVAKNIGVRRALEQELGMEITVPAEPQIVGAVGAALIAARQAGAEKAARQRAALPS
ncbi:MAG: acyl-CoA dehydratase activase [Dehalococcoidia bacterium]|nr:acyl-CoA dehydratase activase [Dehalococcoidia bacterium]